MSKIYFAAPIHRGEDADRNAIVIQALRENGHTVWAPQEAGIATEVSKQTGKPLDEVRAEFSKIDLTAMKSSDMCVAYIDRDEGLSEGMLWEMGWFTGMNKPVIFYNPRKIKCTLMVQFTVDFTVYNLSELVRILGSV